LSAAGVVITSVLLVAALPHWSRAVTLSECEVDGARGNTACDWLPTGTGAPLAFTE
jgi:hypothetical protein